MEKKRLQYKNFPPEFVKLSRTVTVASENTYKRYYYVIKNYAEHKLAIFNVVFLLYLFMSFYIYC